MKKKGFTLIELLAVIVILAIIALIATPLVLKYIEKSRKESKVDSAYSFVRNLETEIANFAIKNNGKKYTTNKESIKELGLDITVKGENPEDGKVCISSVGQVEKGVFQYGKYYVSYDGKKGSISDKDTYDNFSCSGNVAGGSSGSSGNNSVGGQLDYTVSFMVDGEPYQFISVKNGSSISEPPQPTVQSGVFAHWENDDGNIVHFPYTPIGDISLKAVFYNKVYEIYKKFNISMEEFPYITILIGTSMDSIFFYPNIDDIYVENNQIVGKAGGKRVPIHNIQFDDITSISMVSDDIIADMSAWVENTNGNRIALYEETYTYINFKIDNFPPNTIGHWKNIDLY